jgi:hypothetical protein
MTGLSVIQALKKKFNVSTDSALALRLGITGQAIQNWKKRKSLTPANLARLTHTASKAGADHFRRSAIRPLVEFFEIDACEANRSSKLALFDILDGNGGNHPYLSGLRDELDAHHGVYVFFDSRGQAIYAGKARRQSLWKEMNLAFNRERGEIQSIKRVRHPIKKTAYKTSDEKSRQIVDKQVPLSVLAAYFSAYEVADSMINDVEALLVRSFANDLLNKRMERFTRQRKTP